ncbi:43ab1b8c-7699-4c09-a344-cc17b2df94f7 [Thermothielavioides terrestris]|uniref:Phospholipase n=1 Tax=Thermothielavioides terrestris TaxID=2587410 RepID=A0A446BRP0_9PEZI|nr:43ab1b8c-7699-4c09-a344-cc17b2df94f7 [Thermothielavioides terrestris]
MGLHSLLHKAKEGLEELLEGEERHSHTHDGHECHQDASHAEYSSNRFCSFAPQSSGHAKWYVDGASYFWAVSVALEEARESIYILDWWLRLDYMLKAAAERGVRVYVIVYKEVPQALTLNSEHTKHALEALHPNIKVFRHPDHYPSGNDFVSELSSSLQNFSLKTFDLARASEDVIKGLYGTAEDTVLFWAHHEKLCLIDGRVAFMGGLDMCFGRWDTNSHPIADAHPGNVDQILFPGQDYNNARIYDFEDVDKWENNKLDRTKSSRMGWSDISISLSGPIVDSLAIHFVQRWNFIFNSKYISRDIGKYQLLEGPPTHRHAASHLLEDGEEYFGGLHRRFTRHMHRFLGDAGEETFRGPQGPSDGAHIQLTRSCSKWSMGVSTEHSIANAYIEAIRNARHFVYIENQFFITATSDEQKPVGNKIGRAIVDRILRAHENGEYFHIVVVMPAVPAFAGDLKSDGALGTRAIMEFQYNSINRGGHSIVETLRNSGVEDPHRYITFYNLRSFDRINTSAIMGRAERESGVRYETARREFDERYEGYDYERDQHVHGDGRGDEYGWGDGPRRREDYGRGDDGYYGRGGNDYASSGQYGYDDSQYRRYQEAARHLSDQTWDTISACYMENGPDLRRIPWTGSPEDEFNAFVSEELYIHSKVLIADDHLVICGSANLNDRSQLGNHDSEIAVVIEDPTPVPSMMAGRPYTASAFATSLRRQLFRKHLGLLPDQRPDAVTRNWTPVTHDPTNEYDWGSPADRLVQDPMSPEFLRLWQTTARRNTEIFSRAFHPVPNDQVRTWEDYDRFFSRHFVIPGEPAEQAAEGYKQGKVDYGHVVPDEFPGGVEELKDWLAGIRGTLVEMPLQFLIDVEDLAKNGLTLNSLTDKLYT